MPIAIAKHIRRIAPIVRVIVVGRRLAVERGVRGSAGMLVEASGIANQQRISGKQ